MWRNRQQLILGRGALSVEKGRSEHIITLVQGPGTLTLTVHITINALIVWDELLNSLFLDFQRVKALFAPCCEMLPFERGGYLISMSSLLSLCHSHVVRGQGGPTARCSHSHPQVRPGPLGLLTREVCSPHPSINGWESWVLAQ